MAARLNAIHCSTVAENTAGELVPVRVDYPGLTIDQLRAELTDESANFAIVAVELKSALDCLRNIYRIAQGGKTEPGYPANEPAVLDLIQQEVEHYVNTTTFGF